MQVQTMVLETAEKPEFAELVMPEPVSGMTGRIVSNPVSSFVPLLTITAGDMTISVRCIIRDNHNSRRYR